MRATNLLFLALTLGAAAATPARAQEAAAPAIDDATREARIALHAGDFDYLLGDWTFTATDRTYGTYGGRWSALRLPGGEVLDEYRVGDENETYVLLSTVRAYNAVLDRWELIGMGGAEGLQDFGTAQRLGDEMHIEQRFGVASGHPELWRIRYYDITPTSFSWAADRSRDDGATWETGYMTLRATRVGPPRELGSLTTRAAAP